MPIMDDMKQLNQSVILLIFFGDFINLILFTTFNWQMERACLFSNDDLNGRLFCKWCPLIVERMYLENNDSQTN